MCHQLQVILYLIRQTQLLQSQDGGEKISSTIKTGTKKQPLSPQLRNCHEIPHLTLYSFHCFTQISQHFLLLTADFQNANFCISITSKLPYTYKNFDMVLLLCLLLKSKAGRGKDNFSYLQRMVQIMTIDFPDFTWGNKHETKSE